MINKIMEDVGLPKEIRGLSLGEQFQICLSEGLQQNGDEYIDLRINNHRRTMSFHAGVSPREGKQWQQQRNGCGTAFPGLRSNLLKATDQFRKWMLHLDVLIGNSFVEKFLASTEWEQQALPNEFRR
jgi:hypothetical protein